MSAAMEVEKENVDAAPTRKKGVSADDNRESFSPELLRIYYARLFPYEQVRLLVSVRIQLISLIVCAPGHA